MFVFFFFFTSFSFGLVVCGLCWCFVLLLVGVVFLLCFYSVLIEISDFSFKKKKKRPWWHNNSKIKVIHV